METNEISEETRDLLLDIAGKLEAVRDEVVNIAMWYRQPVMVTLTEEQFLKMFTDYSTELEPEGDGRLLTYKAEFPICNFFAYRYITPGSAYALGGV